MSESQESRGREKKRMTKKAHGDGRQRQGPLMHGYTEAIKPQKGLQGAKLPISRERKTK